MNRVKTIEEKATEDQKKKLKDGKNYILQGSIYYCENKQNALCYIKSYEQKINAGNDPQRNAPSDHRKNLYRGDIVVAAIASPMMPAVGPL